MDAFKEKVEKIKEEIKLRDYLTEGQIRRIVGMAIKTRSGGEYHAKVPLQTLMDELLRHQVNAPQFKKDIECIDEKALPSGTYTLIEVNDLGRVGNHCECAGNTPDSKCNHPIRFEFTVMHTDTKRKFVVGSVCIHQVMGEHRLIDVALLLLKKISNRVTKNNKSLRCDEICGDILREVKKVDPNRWFTYEEYKFLYRIENRQSGITLKKAKEFAEKWTDDEIEDLKGRIKNEKDRRDNEEKERREAQQKHLEALKRKRRNQDRTDRDIAEKIAEHRKRCDVNGFLSSIQQQAYRKKLSEKQVTALKRGCRVCGLSII